MNPPGLIPFGVSVVERACVNPPGLIPFGVPVLERRYIAPPEFGTDDIRCCGHRPSTGLVVKWRAPVIKVVWVANRC